MAQRTDVGIRFDLDPRVFRVDAPSVELVVQDLHDTARDIEDEPNAMQYPPTIKTAGKEPLGGGVSVGLTSTLQNMILAFDPRITSVSQGSATAVDADGSVLTDIGADFEADNVKVGAIVVNFTDKSVGSVANVLGPTQLLLFPIVRGSQVSLGDGTGNSWAVNDEYKIWNIEQVTVTGGNVVAIDGLGGGISAILPTFGTQVLQTGSSSATLQELGAIQHSSFDREVTIDLSLTTIGVEFPLGTHQSPVGNFADALAIGNARGFSQLFVIGDATIDSGLDFTGQHFFGESQNKTHITILPGADVVGAEFVNATIEGTLTGEALVENCIVLDLTLEDGLIRDSRLRGTITLGGGPQFSMIDCVDDLAGFGTPTIDFDGGSSPEVIIRGYRGGLLCTNKSGSSDVSIDGVIRLILDATFGGSGSTIVRGIGTLTDNGSAAVTLDLVSLPGGVR